MTLTKRKKTTAIKAKQRHDTDTGSPEVQVSLLTKAIDELSRHLKRHRKDKHSRRGLLAMVARRKNHLDYLKRKNPTKHEELVAEIKG